MSSQQGAHKMNIKHMNIKHEGAWQDQDSFEAYKKGESVSFDRSDDGFRIAIDGHSTEIFHMNADQFAAFKKWIQEN
jgi:hypothetical protein